jgi:hypothetical protein
MAKKPNSLPTVASEKTEAEKTIETVKRTQASLEDAVVVTQQFIPREEQQPVNFIPEPGKPISIAERSAAADDAIIGRPAAVTIDHVLSEEEQEAREEALGEHKVRTYVTADGRTVTVDQHGVPTVSAGSLSADKEAERSAGRDLYADIRPVRLGQPASSGKGLFAGGTGFE